MTVDSPVHHGSWRQLPQFLSLRRTADLALSPDGSRLACSAAQIDPAGAGMVSSLWEIPLAGGPCRRLTDSSHGETDPVFMPDNSLVYVSGQPDDAVPAPGEPALWRLIAGDEARPLATRPGGLTAPLVARGSGMLVAVVQRLTHSTEESDVARRAARHRRRVNVALHEWMPARDVIRDLDIEHPVLLVADGDPADLRWRDVAPHAGAAMTRRNPLTRCERSVSADGSRMAVMWSERRPRGATVYTAVVVDVASGTCSRVTPDDDPLYTSPAISPDGTRLAAMAIFDGTFDTPVRYGLHLFDVRLPTTPSAPVDVVLGDLYPQEWTWSPDGSVLYVSGDLHGRGAVVAIDADSGELSHRLADDAVHTRLAPSPDGRDVYALRAAVDHPPHPVRLDARGRRRPTRLADPAPTPSLPGRLEDVEAAVDGAGVRGWLCLPESANEDAPAPVMLWIHGGPLTSANTWSWGWCPWVAVSHGWAVLMPDPALSTGYGQAWIERGWPHRAARVWRDCEGLLDAIASRGDVDTTRAACLGPSFGGFMTNWIAGHTDRFGAIVTHAGLYALDQHHDTTEQAYRKNRWFGTRAEHPRWYVENSPHDSAHLIRTPMLITHGDADYNVPVTEALRLWWDLCSEWTRDPAEMPHRFLQFPDEAHFILTPAHAEIWYEAVLAFCATHVLDRPTPFSDLIP